MRLHWAVDNRGDIPNTAGLGESIKLPEDRIVRDVQVLYDWKRGTPVPLLFADCFNTNGAVTVDLRGWIESWVPPGWIGHVILDAENWEMDSRANPIEELSAFALKFPDRTWPQMFTKLAYALVLTGRMIRPGCTFGWFAGATWHPDQFDRLTEDRRDMLFADVAGPLLKMDRLHPVTYASLREDEFSPAIEQVKLVVDLNLGRTIEPIVSARLNDGSRFCTRREIRSQLFAAEAMCCRDVHVWEAIESAEHARLLQAWVDDILVPCLDEVNRYSLQR